MATMSSTTWAAGVWEQVSAEDGDGLVQWSRHGSQALAERAARSYARHQTSQTGGALSWAGGVRKPDGSVYWIDRDGTAIA